MIRRCLYVVLAISTLFSLASPTWGEENGILHGPLLRDLKKEEATPSVTEIVVTLKSQVRTYVNRHYDWGNGTKEYRREEAPMSAEEVRKLSKAAGVNLKLKPRSLSHEIRVLHEDPPISEVEARKLSKADGLELIEEHHLLLLPRAMTPREAQIIADKIAKHPDVKYASPSLTGYEMRIPNDALYQSLQWNFQQSAGGVNLPPAWDTDIGGINIVVAVLDGGILPNHADIIGRTVPGYDFVSDPVIANDGSGRDADPTDPGSWVTQADITANPSSLSGCVIPPGQTMIPSSWHGTHVAGIVGANSNNSFGIAGVNWISKILPVRISGKCGKGAEPDLRDAILWAAGIASGGTPTNPNPAKVLNISFGGSGVCLSDLQAAINAAVKKNVIIVAAAGNGDGTNGVNAGNTWPANCANVVTVGSVNRQGGESQFSNYGSVLALSAPGGENTGFPVDWIKSTGDSGTTTAVNDNAFITIVGTSQAAPHVSGVASLMLSARSKLNFRQVRAMLQKTARVFPTGTGRDCTTLLCGAGILDAAEAVHAAESGVGGGEYHSVALQATGSVVSWGYNGNGQLGDGSSLGVVRAYPGPISTLSSGVIDLAAGDFHNTAVKSDGTVWAWGYNGYGQLGNNATVDQGTPIQVATLTSVTATAAGYDHTLALKSDGTVWAWGYNFYGQLGDGTYVDKLTPVQVNGLTGIVAIAAGGKRSIALKNDGTVWAWGILANVTDAFNASESNTPIQVPVLTDVIAIAAAGDATGTVDNDTALALKSDGTVWAWGYNSFGQMGDGTLTSRYLPVQVSGLTDVISIAAGVRYFATAVKSDGTVWAWGNGADGQLGNGSSGNLVYSTTPVQSLGVTKAVAIAAGAGHVLALDADLTIQEWGANNGGQLGNGTTSTAAQTTPIATHGLANIGTYNTANATTAQADLSVTLSATPNPVLTGSNLTYSFTPSNLGSGIAPNTIVTLALAGSAMFVSASGACTPNSGTVVCNLGTMNSGSATGLQVVVTPMATGALSATAYVSSDAVDPNGANNSAAISSTVNAPVAAANDTDVPTLPEWGVILMGSLLLANMAWVSRRKQQH